jgi:REP element-mobilizing transposase RayT
MITLSPLGDAQAGAYFVTIVTWQREMLFGDIVNGETQLNRHGKIVQDAWFDLKNHYGHVELGTFVIMPNHVHGIIVLIDDVRRGGSSLSGGTNLPDDSITGKKSLLINQTRPSVKPKPRHALPEIVRAFKSFSARRINRLRKTDGIPVWQRNYYEHIIRNEREMDNVHRYIESNPARWNDDDENPNNIRM